jgi:hypothetical protein
LEILSLPHVAAVVFCVVAVVVVALLLLSLPAHVVQTVVAMVAAANKK